MRSPSARSPVRRPVSWRTSCSSSSSWEPSSPRCSSPGPRVARPGFPPRRHTVHLRLTSPPPRIQALRLPVCDLVVRARVLPALRNEVRDAEPALEYEGVLPGVVPRPPHLHDADPAPYLKVAARLQAEVDDPVREVVLPVAPVRGRNVPLPARRELADHERRARESPQPLEQPQHLPPVVAEAREDLERVEGVQYERLVREPHADALRVHLEHVPPGSVVAHLLPKRGEVQDAQRAPLLRGIEPEALRVIHEARAALLEAHVEALRPADRVLVQDGVRERRLHRPRRSREEHDGACGDAAAEDPIEVPRVRPQPLHRPSPPNPASCACSRRDRWARSRPASATSTAPPRSAIASFASRATFARSSFPIAEASFWSVRKTRRHTGAPAGPTSARNASRI